MKRSKHSLRRLEKGIKETKRIQLDFKNKLNICLSISRSGDGKNECHQHLDGEKRSFESIVLYNLCGIIIHEKMFCIGTSIKNVDMQH